MSSSPLRIPAVIHAYVQAFNAGDWLAIQALFTPHAKIWGVLGAGSMEVALPIWRELHDGMQMHLEPVAVAQEGETVVVRFRETGKFAGPFRGLADHQPTNRSYEIMAMEWFELENGRIAQRWGSRDSAAITRQVVG